MEIGYRYGVAAWIISFGGQGGALGGWIGGGGGWREVCRAEGNGDAGGVAVKVLLDEAEGGEFVEHHAGSAIAALIFITVK